MLHEEEKGQLTKALDEQRSIFEKKVSLNQSFIAMVYLVSKREQTVIMRHINYSVAMRTNQVSK